MCVHAKANSFIHLKLYLSFHIFNFWYVLSIFFRRRPAWCDRILYRVNSNNYENVNLDIQQVNISLVKPETVLLFTADIISFIPQSDKVIKIIPWFIKIDIRKYRNYTNLLDTWNILVS
jgi:hypothetical protein